jgi:hypothetical protein
MRRTDIQFGSEILMLAPLAESALDFISPVLGRK